MQTVMDNAPQLNTDEVLPAARPLVNGIEGVKVWHRSTLLPFPIAGRLSQFGLSLTDQALAVGGTFLANVVLARTQTKEQYGMFALSYSVFTFLAGLHNAAILEPYTVYGSGRYGNRFSEYLRLMVRVNAFAGLVLTLILLLACLVFYLVAPQIVSGALLGLGITVGILLSGAFLRRVFYLQRQAAFAAQASLMCFVTVVSGLWLTARAHVLSGFSVFLILALGWVTAGIGLGKKLALGNSQNSFVECEPNYWREHWRYSKWVLATAFVFQFTTQGYYWLVAGFLSVKRVAELRAISMLVAPIEQVFIALSFLVLPALAARYASGEMRAFFSLQRRYRLGILVTTLLFVFAVRIVGAPAMHLLYAGKFDDLAHLLYLLAFSPLIMGLGNTMNHALKAVEQSKLVFFAYACSGTATFLVGIPLVMHFGLHGAIYGLLLSGTVYTGALAVSYFFVIHRKAHRLELP